MGKSDAAITGRVAIDDAAHGTVGGCGVLDVVEAAIAVDGEAAQGSVR